MKEIIFVTGNKHKLEIAKYILNLYNIEVENIDLNVDEIQEVNIEKIAIKNKTFRMDTSLTIKEYAEGNGSVMDQLMEIQGQKSNYGSLSLEEKLQWWKNTDNYFHEFAKWYASN